MFKYKIISQNSKIINNIATNICQRSKQSKHLKIKWNTVRKMQLIIKNIWWDCWGSPKK